MHLGPEHGDFGFHPSINLTQLEVMRGRLVPDPPFFKIEIESNTSLGPRDFLPQLLFLFG